MTIIILTIGIFYSLNCLVNIMITDFRLYFIITVVTTKIIIVVVVRAIETKSELIINDEVKESIIVFSDNLNHSHLKDHIAIEVVSMPSFKNCIMVA